MKWKERYTCNHDEMDRQHQKLFEILSRLYSMVDIGRITQKEFNAVIMEYKEYMVYHLGFEEKLFEQYQYPEAPKKEHQSEHQSFCEDVHKILQNKDRLSHRRISEELVIYTVRWIVNHILKTDKKFGNFIKSIEDVNFIQSAELLGVKKGDA